ncbi:uncharacterized protein LOC143192931 [Rhynchophorus ferrugineus]|uniref:uncharacterized protein LOC143192931 n=1 Tax=Rhynchophorus ferrugineus TaxID=354439 RepID=UPI003FCEC97C
MKSVGFLVLVCLTIGSFGSSEIDQEQIKEISRKITEINFNNTDFNNDFKMNILKAVLGMQTVRVSDTYDADVTNFTEQLLTNVRALIIDQGLEPLQLPDEKVNLVVTGNVHLTNGWLTDLSTIWTYDEVQINYSNETKILDVTLPLSFDVLLITYDYKTKIILVTIHGDLKAKVKKVKLNLHLGFNFNTYQAFVDKLDVKKSGTITIEFTGLGLLNWIIDAMSDVLIALFHNLILGIVDSIIQTPVQAVVEDINEIINNFLYPSSLIKLS